MSRAEKLMRLIKKSAAKIDDCFDMQAEDVRNICENSNDKYDMVYNGFLYGYTQGMKAKTAEISAEVAS